MSTIRPDLLVTVNRAARARGIYAPRLRRAIRAGRVPAYRVGSWLRVRLADVDAWVESCRYRPREIRPGDQAGLCSERDRRGGVGS